MMEVDTDSDEILGPSDEEEETTTAGEVLLKLQKGWINEKMAPELLAPLTEEVECMIEQLKAMEGNLANCQPRDEIIKYHKMEIERIRYLISSYMRTRLAKIQKYAWCIKKEESARPNTEPSKLMAEEVKFLKDYLQVLEGHLQSIGTANMPDRFQGLDIKQMTVEPNKDAFVFFRVNRDANVSSEDPEGNPSNIFLVADGQYLMTYRSVKNLVASEMIQLV